MSELEEWEEALPEGKDTLQVSFGPSIDIERQKIDWVINIESESLGYGEKYFSKASFSPEEMEIMTLKSDDSMPLELDVAVPTIEDQIAKCIQKYIMQEIINNE